MRLISRLCAVFLLSISAAAQNIHVYPASTPAAPKGTVQTCTAMVNGYNDKTVTWTVSPTPTAQYGGTPTTTGEPATVSIYSTSTSATYTITATANADHTKTGTCTVTYTPSPTPVTTHPRLIVTNSMLSGLQAKGTSSNLWYNSSIKAIASTYHTNYSSIWTYSTWSGSACTGGSGPSSDQSGLYTEVGAFWMAKVALFDNDATTRNTYGCAARDVFMTNVGYVNSGAFTISGNRAGDSALEWSLLADWLMGGGYLSSSDQVAVRQYLYKMAQEQLNGAYGTVAPIGSYNSLTQFQQGDEFSATFIRAMGNNYTNARILLMTASALTFNDNTTDDPPLTNTCSATRYQVCPDGTAGSLHAYWTYLTGSLLFLDYAHLEDPSVALPVYAANYTGFGTMPQCDTVATATNGWTVPCFGDGRGGESNEGYIYGDSTEWLRRALNAIHTAGYDDPALYGPQMSLGTSSYWDLRQVSDLTQLVGLSGSPTQQSQWAFLTNGDTNSYETYTSNFAVDAAMLEGDLLYGRSDRNSALEWIVLNSPFGGPNGTTGGCSGSCGITTQIGNDLGSTVSMEMFIAAPGNPLASLPSDPRSSLPSDWYDAGNQHIVVRDGGWTSGTIFDEWNTVTQIDHEHQFSGGFDLYSNGEYITKRRTEMNDYNDAMSLSMYSNAEPLMQLPGQTYCTFSPYCAYWQSPTYGGNIWHGYEAGPTTLVHAELPGYVAAVDTATGAYNGASGSYGHFTHATGQSRSLLYLRGSKQVVLYDRGATDTAWSKTDAILTTGAPTLAGNTATWATRSSNQKAALTYLLPAGVTVSTPKLPIYTTVTAPHSVLNASSTMQAACVVTFGDGSTLDVTSATPSVWSTDNTAVLTVSTTGLVTPVATDNGANLVCNYLGSNTQIGVATTSGASSGSINSANTDQQADWELYGQVKADAGSVASTQFLSVLQFGAAAFTPATATLVQSSAGQNFDGALFGSTLAMFMRSQATFSGVTYPASGATTHYVSDLTPNTSYTIAGTGAPSSGTTDSAGVLSFAATGTGSITVGGGTPPPPPTSYVTTITGVFSGVVVIQ